MARLLLIEDSPADREQIRDVIQSSRLFDHILEAEDGLEGIKLLLSGRFDAVLSSLELSGASGDKILVIRNSLDERSRCPFLMLTEGSDYRRSAELMHDGVSDVISKPFYPADLVARLDNQLRISRLQRKLIKKVELLEHLATTDPLTGLRNRAYLCEALGVEFERAMRYGVPLCVVLADVDHFKQVNDSAGHATGDLVLRTVGEMLSKNLRKSDVGGRYGGDEFLAVLAHNQLKGAAVFAERWREAVEHVAVRDEKDVPGATISLGVACYSSKFGRPEDLVEAADVALLEAKRSHRNQVVLAPD